MKLLFDQNLSRHLVGRLQGTFPGSTHVTSIDLDTATDEEIWRYAGEHDFIVISKDSDFRQLAFLHGPPPKVVWLRVGNASSDDILAVIVEHAPVITHFGASADEAMLAIPTVEN